METKYMKHVLTLEEIIMSIMPRYLRHIKLKYYFKNFWNF